MLRMGTLEQTHLIQLLAVALGETFSLSPALLFCRKG